MCVRDYRKKNWDNHRTSESEEKYRKWNTNRSYSQLTRRKKIEAKHYHELYLQVFFVSVSTLYMKMRVAMRVCLYFCVLSRKRKRDTTAKSKNPHFMNSLEQKMSSSNSNNNSSSTSKINGWKRKDVIVFHFQKIFMFNSHGHSISVSLYFLFLLLFATPFTIFSYNIFKF